MGLAAVSFLWRNVGAAMPPGAVQQGPNAVTNPQALMSALQAQQPPTNPQTPFERINPDKQFLEMMEIARFHINKAREYQNDPFMLAALDAVEGVIKSAQKVGVSGQTILETYIQSAQSLSPMLASAPGMQPPMGGPPGQPPMGGPPQGGPMPAGAPPQGAPLQ